MTVNLFAGMGSHQSAKSQTDVWLTPPAIIDALGGPDSFDLDPCSLPDRPWPTARNHFTIEDNGLIQAWHGRIWLNPPYSLTLVRRFMGRMASHGCGIALIFARTETDHFHRFVWGSASAVLFLRGRLNFHLPSGEPAAKNGGAPSVLIAYGDEDRDLLAAAPIDGFFMPLRLPKSWVLPAVPQTWRQALASFFEGSDGPVSLGELYQAFARHPKARANSNWQAKIRQILQRGEYERVERGVWVRRGVNG
jgi:DNA N-6-adenine-methyltransferase (Dam)